MCGVLPLALLVGARFGADAKSSLPALVKCAIDADALVRQRCVSAIGSMGAAAGDAIPVLTELQHDKDRQVAFLAEQALRNVTAAREEPAESH